MGGFFGVALKHDCVFDLFFGTDYHSHLGTRRGGMVVHGEEGFERAIHNIENAPFRTKFERDVNDMKGNLGIGCISDYEPQPLIVRSHLGNFAITTVGRINNAEALVAEAFAHGTTHFLEMSGGNINATELVAALINARDSIPEGIRYAQERIDGSMSMLVLTPKGLYAARDRMGRTPVVIGQKDEGYCAVFESSAYLNLGYTDCHELGPGEVDFITSYETSGYCKPDLGFYQELLDRFHITANECVMVGNEIGCDLKVAAASGTRGILLNTPTNHLTKEEISAGLRPLLQAYPDFSWSVIEDGKIERLPKVEGLF